MEYTVKQLAILAGISPRTLRFYDEIGLLKPEKVGANRYRYYGEKSLLRLQQILFYRELTIDLESIRKIMDDAQYDELIALAKHRRSLEKRIERYTRLIETLDTTMKHLQEGKKMEDSNLFKAFSEEEQEKYAREAEQKYDPEIVRTSQEKWKAYTEADKKRIGEEGNAAYTALVNAIPLGPGSSEAQAGVELWRKHMDYFWTPSMEQLVGLTELYLQDARFKANFDRIDPRLAEFMHEAVKIYTRKMQTKE